MALGRNIDRIERNIESSFFYFYSFLFFLFVLFFSIFFSLSIRFRKSGRSTMALGRNIDRIERNIESIESKFAKTFKRPKNREDGSDFDDFWTESIVSTQLIFSKKIE